MNTIRKPNLTTAIDSDGNYVFINEVKSGLACNCFCPHCKARLIAINSKPEKESKAHHFAHERGSDCIWSDESELHKLAKEVLAEEKKIMLPILEGEAEATQLVFDSVLKESKDPITKLIPDCVCSYGDHKLWVEFKRTHEVDKKKADKIRNAKIDCIEIDLKECKINKEEVRKFITEDISHRIWVYNSKNHSTKIFAEKGPRKEANYMEHNYVSIDRHLAFDERAFLVNLSKISHDYNLAEHHYYCINCGKEVKIVDGHFEHLEESRNCIDGFYLMKAAKEVIYYSFNNNPRYEMDIPEHHFCEKFDSCPLADENQCYKYVEVTYELKKLGYTLCEKDFQIPGHQEKIDIVLRKPQSIEDAIFVTFSTEDCQRDMNTDYRQIAIGLTTENNVMLLGKKLYIGEYHNFVEKRANKVEPAQIETKPMVLKFTLYGSGKCYIAPVECTERKNSRSGKVLQEYIFKGEPLATDNARLLALYSCYENKSPGFYCEICSYLRRNPNKSPICIRYNTQGTPRNPLPWDPKACNCNYFRMNNELINTIKEECKDVCLIDPTKDNQ